MPTQTRSGWTIENGHMPPLPDMNTLTPAQQQTYFNAQLKEPQEILFRNIRRNAKLQRFSQRGRDIQNMAEAAYFGVNTFATLVYCNWTDRPQIDLLTGPGVPASAGYTSVRHFVQSITKVSTKKIESPVYQPRRLPPAPCITRTTKTTLQRWAKTCGEIEKTTHTPSQQWLNDVGPVIKNICFHGKYNIFFFPPSFSLSLSPSYTHTYIYTLSV